MGALTQIKDRATPTGPNLQEMLVVAVLLDPSESWA